MAIAQTPSPLNNILSAKTYNAAWFSGVTVEAQITAAIAAAAADSAKAVFIPANMLPYTPANVTFNSLIQMIAEGTNPAELDVVSYGGIADGGVTDNGPAYQAMFNAAVAFGRGYMRSRPNGLSSYGISTTATLNPTSVSGGDFVLDFSGARIDYSGATYPFDFDASGTTSTASKLRVIGGRWVGTAAAASCLRFTDIGAAQVSHVDIQGFTNGIAIHLRNFDAWSENNNFEHIRVTSGFKHVIKTDPASVTGGTGTSSFARTGMHDVFASGGLAGQPWLYLNGTYDSQFDFIHGNVGNGVSAIVACYGALGGSMLRGIRVESSGSYYGAHIDALCTNAPVLEDYDFRNSVDTFTTSSVLTNEAKKRIYPGMARSAAMSRSISAGPSVYYVNSDNDNYFHATAATADIYYELPPISRCTVGQEFTWRVVQSSFSATQKVVLGAGVFPAAPAGWVAGVSYVVGQLVTDAARRFVCMTAHNPSTAADEPSVGVNWQTYWKAVDWLSGANFTSEQYVINGGNKYWCILDHTSTATDEPGVGVNWATYWILISDTVEGQSSLALYAGQTLTLKWRGTGTDWTLTNTSMFEDIIDGWYMENVVQNQNPTAALTRLATTTDNPTAWIVPKAGWLTLIQIHSNAPRTAGTCTAFVYVNTVQVAALSTVLDINNTTFNVGRQKIGISPVLKGDLVEVKFVISAGFLPTGTGDMRASVGITS